MDTRFHSVYLLTSLDPQLPGAYYIGYSLNPVRRLRQHNGELVNGARRTRKCGRPWILLLCVSGFGEDRIALKFEWCWQHPAKSAKLKTQVQQLRGASRLTYAVGVLHLLLRTDPFSRLQLMLHIFSTEHFEQVMGQLLLVAPTISPLTETALLRLENITPEEFQTRYMDESREDGAVESSAYFIRAPLGSNSAGGDAEFRQLDGCGAGSAHLCEEDVIRQYVRERALMGAGRYPCALCALPLKCPFFLRCSRAPFCGLRTHITCLAMWFTYHSLQNRASLVVQGAAADECADNVNFGRVQDQTADCSFTSFTSQPIRSTCSQPFNGNGATSPTSGSSAGCSPQRRPGSSSPPLTQIHMSQTDSAGDLAGPALVPRSPCVCPLCDETLQWGALLYDLKRRATVDKRQADRMRREAMEAILAQRLERLQCAGSKKSAPRSRSKLGGNGRKRKGANGVSLPSSQSEAGHGDDVLLSGGRDNAVRSASQYGRSVSPTNSASQTSIPLEDILPVTEFNADEWLDL